MDEQKYRLKRYNYKSWCIQECHLIKSGDNAGNWTDWIDYKYPGTLEQAIRGLWNLAIPDNVGYTPDEIVGVIKDTETRVLDWFKLTILDDDK